jgi:hypothetical protein
LILLLNVNRSFGGLYVTVSYSSSNENVDYASTSAAVENANLLGRLPLVGRTANLIHSSRFQKNIPHDLEAIFLEDW